MTRYAFLDCPFVTTHESDGPLDGLYVLINFWLNWLFRPWHSQSHEEDNYLLRTKIKFRRFGLVKNTDQRPSNLDPPWFMQGRQWRTATGQLKTFAARSLLLKLEQRDLVKLPNKTFVWWRSDKKYLAVFARSVVPNIFHVSAVTFPPAEKTDVIFCRQLPTHWRVTPHSKKSPP